MKQVKITVIRPNIMKLVPFYQPHSGGGGGGDCGASWQNCSCKNYSTDIQTIPTSCAVVCNLG